MDYQDCIENQRLKFVLELFQDRFHGGPHAADHGKLPFLRQMKTVVHLEVSRVLNASRFGADEEFIVFLNMKSSLRGIVRLSLSIVDEKG